MSITDLTAEDLTDKTGCRRPCSFLKYKIIDIIDLTSIDPKWQGCLFLFIFLHYRDSFLYFCFVRLQVFKSKQGADWRDRTLHVSIHLILSRIWRSFRTFPGIFILFSLGFASTCKTLHSKDDKFEIKIQFNNRGLIGLN